MVLLAREHEVWTEDGLRLILTEHRPLVRTARGPVFMLVAGFAQNRRAFLEGPLPVALARRGARVFIGELRGHGRSRSGKPPPRWTIDGHVEYDLPALTAHALRVSGARRLHFVGHSLGGLLALAWLPRRPPLSTLTTIASPLRLGSDRPVVRRAAALAKLVNGLRPYREVPMRAFLGALAAPLSRPRPNWVCSWLQRYTALASPTHACPVALERILSTADPESPAVFQSLLGMAVTGRPVLGGHDLARNGRQTRMPWVAIHGGRDIFAPPSSVSMLTDSDHAGPRWLLEIPGATHVDVAMGHHIERLVDRWWHLLFPVDIAGVSP